MKKEELAKLLNGREYLEEMSKDEIAMAVSNNLVVVFGASDDHAILEGAISDQVDCYNGGQIFFVNGELLLNKCDYRDCPYHFELKKSAIVINIEWCKDDYSWVYETEIPHATFAIYEGDEKYCRGIVFHVDDITISKDK